MRKALIYEQGGYLRSNAFLIVLLLIIAGVALVSAGSVVHDTVDDPELAEASGLASSLLTPGILYTHNDSGGTPTVYTLNRRGLVPARIKLKGVTNRDWEDIAVARDPRTQKPCVYVGDIGDNNARYSSVFVYRFEEIPLEDTLMSVSRIDKYEIVYEDGPRDAEALLVDPRNGDICIISKREEQVGVYLVPYPQSTDKVNQAKKIATLPYSWVTAADISPNGKYILVKTYTNIYRYKRSGSKTLAQAFAKKPKTMPYKLEQQGEAVAWDHKGKGYFTLSERVGSTPAELYYYK